jgi:hypothetical protein
MTTHATHHVAISAKTIQNVSTLTYIPIHSQDTTWTVQYNTYLNSAKSTNLPNTILPNYSTWNETMDHTISLLFEISNAIVSNYSMGVFFGKGYEPHVPERPSWIKVQLGAFY